MREWRTRNYPNPLLEVSGSKFKRDHEPFAENKTAFYIANDERRVLNERHSLFCHDGRAELSQPDKLFSAKRGKLSQNANCRAKQETVAIRTWVLKVSYCS